jgi:PEGA domain-containing protein
MKFHDMIGPILLLLTLLPQGTPPKSPASPPSQTQRAQRPPANAVQPPLTLKQVIDALSVKPPNSSRVEALIANRGVQFQGTPAILSILKEFNASPKLLSMIPPAPAAPSQPVLPTPKNAGDLTVVCEPKDCSVIVDDMYKGVTAQNRTTLKGLHAGDATIQVIADGFVSISRKIQLQEGKPVEEKFLLKRSDSARQQRADALLLNVLLKLGGADGLAELGDIEGSGTLQWTDSDGKAKEWTITFAKRIGKDLTTTFKARDGQCSASIVANSSKQDCQGNLKKGGEEIAAQATSLLLSYQVQDVLQALLNRTVLSSEADDNRLESSNSQDSYVLTLGSDNLPTDLVYTVADSKAPIHVQYSNYVNLKKSRYPGRIAIGRVDKAPVWIFTLNSVRSRLARNQ